MQRAKSECDILKIRMRRWDEEIAELNSCIEESLANPNFGRSEKAKFEDMIKKNEEKNVKERDEAMKKIMKTTNEELNSETTQFLLKYVEDGDSGEEDNVINSGGGTFRGPKNSWGWYTRPKNWRGSRM